VQPSVVEKLRVELGTKSLLVLIASSAELRVKRKIFMVNNIRVGLAISIFRAPNAVEESPCLGRKPDLLGCLLTTAKSKSFAVFQLLNSAYLLFFSVSQRIAN
jgi:hypothetical protein